LVYDEQTLIEEQHDHFNNDNDGDAKKAIYIKEEWFDHTFLLFTT
jgi:hypothetical protein